MEIDTLKVKVPGWVNTDDEGVCMLFAFIRRIAIEYKLHGIAIDMYGYDIRKILDIMNDDLHEYLVQFVDPEMCQIAKLNREHFIFKIHNHRRYIREVNIKQTKNITRWAYLMGCTNYNLLEPDGILLETEKRPHYCSMQRYDRDLFMFSNDRMYE
jgi:hypothetical protein|tara:strand:+ start:550 stop:1017 length:468 start_codon:yes stop_codon:yes gene_type:complete